MPSAGQCFPVSLAEPFLAHKLCGGDRHGSSNWARTGLLRASLCPAGPPSPEGSLHQGGEEWPSPSPQGTQHQRYPGPLQPPAGSSLTLTPLGSAPSSHALAGVPLMFLTQPLWQRAGVARPLSGTSSPYPPAENPALKQRICMHCKYSAKNESIICQNRALPFGLGSSA